MCIATGPKKELERYDIAFSLLRDDEPIARAIQAHLTPEATSFLYSTRQRELVLQRDGLNAFPAVFRGARICVILYRAGWGETPWTRLEERTLGDRYRNEGSAFLVLIRLDAAGVPFWFPQSDLWVTYDPDGPLRAAEYILDKLRHPERDIRARITARTLDRRPVSLARYQRQKTRATNQYVPLRPEICDACTTQVAFRPITCVRLPEFEGLPPTEEKLCPPCARERGMAITSSVGMDEAVLYGKRDPNFAYYVRCLLRHPVCTALSEDAELKALGISNVGAVIAGESVDLLVCGDWQRAIEVPLDLRSMEAGGVKSASALIDHARGLVLEAFHKRPLGSKANSH
jgi:hypothetical protein